MQIKITRDQNPQNPRLSKNWAEIILDGYTFGDRSETWIQISKVIADPAVVALPIYLDHDRLTTDGGTQVIGAAIMHWSKAKKIFQSVMAAMDVMREEVDTLEAWRQGKVWAYQLLEENGEVVEAAGGYFDKVECEKAAIARARFIEHSKDAWAAALEVTRQAHDWAKETT